jgi:predicted transcriptional regulator
MICGQCSKFNTKSYLDLKRHQKTVECEGRNIWIKIIDARRSGQETLVDRLLRKAYGIKTEMSEETKQKLRKYYQEHKEEINLARKIKKASKKRHNVK